MNINKEYILFTTIENTMCVVDTKSKPIYEFPTPKDVQLMTEGSLTFLIINHNCYVEVLEFKLTPKEKGFLEFKLTPKECRKVLSVKSRGDRTNYDVKYNYPFISITDLSNGNFQKYQYVDGEFIKVI